MLWLFQGPALKVFCEHVNETVVKATETPLSTAYDARDCDLVLSILFASSIIDGWIIDSEAIIESCGSLDEIFLDKECDIVVKIIRLIRADKTSNTDG